IATLQHSWQMQGKANDGYTYREAFLALLPAANIALTSAWMVSLYLTCLSKYLPRSSSTPLGNPLYPCPTTMRFSSTRTAPTLVDGSLLHVLVSLASSRNLLSHLESNIGFIKGRTKLILIKENVSGKIIH